MDFVNRFIEWAHMCLLDNEEAQSYLRSRGSSIEQWKSHRLGFVSSDFDVDPTGYTGHSDKCDDKDYKSKWCDICRYRRWSSVWESEEGEQYKKQYVGRRIIGHVVLPLTSYSGTTVGFQVRSIKEKSYDTFVVNRRPEGYFFGVSVSIQEIWNRREVAIVEGPFDHLILERLVTPCVVALTTNSVNSYQMKFFRRFVDRIYSCLDNDKAGKDGKKSLIKQLGSDIDIRSVDYSSDKDLNDFWQRVGDEQFSRKLKKEIEHG